MELAERGFNRQFLQLHALVDEPPEILVALDLMCRAAFFSR
ncbi:hypothetical protein [Deinococcus arenicola]|uniref:Uncharacterized protein n=1 Tax=Deinococcus arenicola TaxID=2994950 RepID=A0ABU4DUW1_9DEIO|nr:hypothetical protein [Deinococcus sp. ZS9-10]MDV6376196.1 hypothetical protein [Deinococcus sp. ZS9-10]